ncbi:MAG: Uma2 family endonuclease [Chloroflexi bacterium]|nr:Uma2 family endonuclease [Chloroflexota bacterium]
MAISILAPKTQIYYPETDGKPMAETLQHILVITYLLSALRDYFRNALDVYVGANNLIYYEEGEPSSVFAPDCYVIFGLDKTPRRVYKLWQEKRVPSVTFEITSHSTWMEDLGNKRVLYAKLGVQEYFIYDVEHADLEPPLQGFRLEQGEYVRIVPDEHGRLVSRELGLTLQEIDGTLRLIHPATNEIVLTPDESYEAAREAEEAAREAEQAAREAEAHTRAVEQENARLRAELEKLRGKQA